MRLVPGWKSCWRWFSIQLIGVSAAFQAAYMAMPDVMRTFLPEPLSRYVAITVLVAAIAGRLVDQPDTPAPPKEDHARLG